MCLILDACAFGAFFVESNAEHKKFAPALKWVLFGSGKLVYGGSKYLAEMKGAPKFQKMIVELERNGKVVRIKKNAVDKEQKIVEKIETHSKFDDPHLVAIVRASGCRVICTNEKVAIKYLKNKKFYPKPLKKPKLYTSEKSATVLCDSNIVDVCRRGNCRSRKQRRSR